ncbi:Rrf2 family transcriptional regulator [Aneurinibacillus sp. Ricciae_BoGa-3]|uniref:RrF2 family transcriptional regulator n=1 Tax=Aneurinibacillus sp. Ricciae_BoGa-3 TaxID=3022697 RepID=UPI00233FB78C|nr:Rrf2 family transcriptional regulator [Aneurinibacillus sp. Ricciae_BoGa-3]WCK56209.1 Rrf2 family transcriptional regulator [Aneurinibacillus sp. Ricciae_BoGa-3]
MKISSKGEYALRALIVLGQNRQHVVSIGEIAERTAVPVNYLEQILLQLKNHGFVKSKRGVYGGYTLSVPPENIFIGEVVRKLEGPLAPMGCVSVSSYEPCLLENGCKLKPLWSLIRDTIACVLDSITLDDVIKGNIKSVIGGMSLA